MQYIIIHAYIYIYVLPSLSLIDVYTHGCYAFLEPCRWPRGNSTPGSLVYGFLGQGALQRGSTTVMLTSIHWMNINGLIWIGFRESRQETMDFPLKHIVFL